MRQTMSRRALLAAAAPPAPLAATRRRAPKPRRNLVLIVIDDLAAWDLDEGLSWIAGKAATDGVIFPNFVVENPVCDPSRATLLTGRTFRSHGVARNGTKSGPSGWNVLRAASNTGYRVSAVGKLVGGWGPRYQTEKLGGSSQSDDSRRQEAVAFVRKNAGHPFLLWVGTHAPHRPHKFAARHRDLYPDAVPPDNPAVNEADVSEKPAFIRRQGQVNGLAGKVRDRLRSLKAVDELVSAVWRAVEDEGAAERTTLLVVSDNGFCIGEHRLYGKGVPYDPAIRVTAVAWGQGFSEQAGTVDRRLATNLDIAPTIAALLDLPRPGRVDAFQGDDIRSVTRDGVRLGYRGGAGGTPHFDGYRTLDWMYAEYQATDERELYDLDRDPHELENLLSDQDGRVPSEADLAQAERLRAAMLAAP